jgi:hypothetical protein
MYKEFENGFGNCVNCVDMKLVRPSRMVADSKMDRIKAELKGQMVNA